MLTTLSEQVGNWPGTSIEDASLMETVRSRATLMLFRAGQINRKRLNIFSCCDAIWSCRSYTRYQDPSPFGTCVGLLCNLAVRAVAYQILALFER